MHDRLITMCGIVAIIWHDDGDRPADIRSICRREVHASITPKAVEVEFNSGSCIQYTHSDIWRETERDRTTSPHKSSSVRETQSEPKRNPVSARDEHRSEFGRKTLRVACRMHERLATCASIHRAHARSRRSRSSFEVKRSSHAPNA